MRRVVPELDLFRSVSLPHEHARELEVMDQILCANPTIVRWVWKDLQGHVEEGRLRFGRPGLSAQQVLRSAIIKQMNGFSYEALAFHLADSLTYLRFCGFTHPLDVPGKSALAKNIKRICEATWQKINQVILHYAEAQGVEDGRKVRIDATVTESNIHHPTDSALLFDCVRTLSRILGQARAGFGIASPNRCKAAKRRHMEIVNAKRNAHRIEPYRKLLKLTEETIRYAVQAVERLHRVSDPMAGVALRLARELEHYIPLTQQVVSQTRRRVLNGESVPADEKIVSIFEPHTDIIRKDRRDTYYGHKVTLTGGVSGLVLDWVVEQGNPADSTLLIRMLERQRDQYGRSRAKLPWTVATPARIISHQPRHWASSNWSSPRSAASRSTTWSRKPGSSRNSGTSGPESKVSSRSSSACSACAAALGEVSPPSPVMLAPRSSPPTFSSWPAT